MESEIDYGKLLQDQGWYIYDKDDPTNTKRAIEAMKSAVSAAIPIILGFVVEKAELYYDLRDSTNKVSAKSILSLAEDADLKIKLGIEK